MEQAVTCKVVWSLVRTNAEDRRRSLGVHRGAGGPDNSHQQSIRLFGRKLKFESWFCHLLSLGL